MRMMMMLIVLLCLMNDIIVMQPVQYQTVDERDTFAIELFRFDARRFGIEDEQCLDLLCNADLCILFENL